MGNDKHFNQILFNKLSVFIEQEDYASLTAYLGTLSHSQFRTSGYILGEQIAAKLNAEDFWKLFNVLVKYNPKAFLSTMLKSFVFGMKQNRLFISDKGYENACELLRTSSIDTQKTISIVLPAITDVNLVRPLFLSLGYTEMSTWIFFLLKSFNTVTAFVLLQALHYVEQDRELLLKIARHILKQENSLAYNVVSIIRSVYDLNELKGTFSLRTQPYELSRIESSYEAFCQLVNTH